MRKIFVIFISAVLLSVMLIGCDTNPQPGEGTTEGTTMPQGPGIIGEEVLDNFEKMLEPIDDQFTMTRPEKVNLEEGESSLYVYVTDRLTGTGYRISVGCTNTGAVKSVIMSALQGSRTELNFALLSCYLYESLELPEMDAKDFYDHFNLLTTEPEGQLTTDGWFLDIRTNSGLLSFVAAVDE